MTKSYNVAYEIGQVVYLKTDLTQSPRMCTGYKIGPYDVLYALQSASAGETFHFDIEISPEQDKNMLMGIDQ